MKSKTPDARRFTKVGNTWYSNRTYKTERGAIEYISKLQRSQSFLYNIVKTSEYSYRAVDTLPIVYRVAVKG